MSRKKQLSERKQTIHRFLNTTMSVIAFVMFLLMLNPVIKSTQDLYEDVQGIKETKITRSELAQIVKDEGYRSKPYKDSRGLWTIGFGHLIKKGENFKTLSSHDAVQLLRKDYSEAKLSVEKRYLWAKGDVKLVLINMTYQMGSSRLKKFVKTMQYLEKKDYDNAAGEMLNSLWANQTPLRASRLAGRIMQLNK